MSEPLEHVEKNSVITGWDFSTGGVKCLAFDLNGKTVASIKLPTDLWREEDGAIELNVMQLEGQARASARAIASALRDQGRLEDWVAGGISATHHTSGRIDSLGNQVRRAICWNDKSLAAYHKEGLEALGGPERARELIGGPWAVRYSLSHLVKDAHKLDREDWERTWYILSHGSLAAGYLTGSFGTTSVSCAASTGIMDFRTKTWCREMLNALPEPWQREMAWKQLPKIVEQEEAIGRLSESLCLEIGLNPSGPLIFPTSDDQQAGLVGGGAVDAGQLAIILGNSAVVNASSDQLPTTDDLDAMRLNWGPYLWMRCYSNGAQFVDDVIGAKPDYEKLEAEARKEEPGCNGTSVLPFKDPEPSLKITKECVSWHPGEPESMGKRYRAALESLGYLIALGVKAHEKSGQKISRITVSGGIARSELMCEILATMLNQPLELLESDEGSALGAAVTALAALETSRRKENGNEKPFTVGDAVTTLVKFRDRAEPNPKWREAYARGLEEFEKRVAASSG